MRLAVISDIHSNAEALRAVLAEIDNSAVDRIICLGDVIGYGPEPLDCIDLVMKRCELTILGNHDFACRTEPVNFNAVARDAALWTKERLELKLPDAETQKRRIEYLDSLPVRQLLDDDERVLCVHGSSLHSTNEYIFPEDGTRPDVMAPVFRFASICFEGHTHWPTLFIREVDSPPNEGDKPPVRYSYYRGMACEGRRGTFGGGFSSGIERMELRLSEGTKYIINPGSVGQPRDGDSWASWAILDWPDWPNAESSVNPTISFHRTNYDFMKVQERIEHFRQQGDPRLSEFLGERLGMGK